MPIAEIKIWNKQLPAKQPPVNAPSNASFILPELQKAIIAPITPAIIIIHIHIIHFI